MSAIGFHTDAQRLAIWHDVECGGYAADLPLWRALAAERPGPILELGCGTGRVAIDLARNGTPSWALDIDANLIEELEQRGAELPLQAAVGDLLSFELDRRFGLVAAPMQVFQLLGGRQARLEAIDRAGAHLEPGGLLAIAIVEGAPAAARAPDYGPVGALPDIAERDGWVYSSLPLGVVVEDGAMIVQRLRQIVSPEGEMTESRSEERLDVVAAGDIEDELRDKGLEPVRQIDVPATDAHIGSLILVAEAPR